jgi:aminopeptidase YwaD
MKITLRFLQLAFSLILFVSAAKAQQSEYARQIVDTLASPYMKGRGYVGKGNRIAATYIANEFKHIGLIPLEKNYIQKFNVSVNTFPGRMSCILDNDTLSPGKDFLVDPASPGKNGNFQVIAISRDELLDDKNLIRILGNADGKFILIDDRSIDTESKDEKAKTNDIIRYIRYNPKLKNAGTILLTDKKLSWYPSTIQVGKAGIILNQKPVPAKFKKVNISIQNKFIKKFHTQNVVGMIRGTTQPDSFLVITAHYDHLGMMGRKTLFPGANDNASGTAMLLDLARYYSKNPPRNSMIFISLGAEELGLLGASYFVEHPLIDLRKIRFLINFDLAGTGDEGIKVVNGSVYRQQFDRLKQINQEFHFLPAVEIRGEACNSDHCIFYQQGVPCFYIYTLGGISAYHDIYDRRETLPLTEFDDYFKLITKFLDTF